MPRTLAPTFHLTHHCNLRFFDERIRTRTFKPLSAHERCHIGDRQFSIAPDGALYPCIQFVTTEGLIS